MTSAWLSRPMDNSPLILFRIILGALISLESFGAIATGWVRQNLVEPKFTFNFIGFDWLQPLVGPQMYVYFVVMGILGLCIMLGYRYRISILAFTLLWTGAYLLQKTSYNNHYYLLILICFIMSFLPANRAYSLDVKRDPGLHEQSMPAYVKWLFVAQLFIVYTYASVAKFYGDWLDYSFIEHLLSSKADYPIIGSVLQTPFIHKIVAGYGLIFDLLIVPALLWKRTRMIAFILSVVFHLFNSIVFQIGIFPYLALGLFVFFFEPERIRNLFFPKRPIWDGALKEPYRLPSWFSWLWITYLIIQIALPVRHYFIPDDVLWTEEGHRLSWRMMLRTRSGTVHFEVENKETKGRTIANLADYLTAKQNNRIGAYPDFIWQFAQILKKEYKEKGIDVAVYAKAKVKINTRTTEEFIDTRVDLANEPWDHFKHHHWILPSPLNETAFTKLE
ncbi:MAG: HTTM domain-containing protein [Eudoraea sp.]|nr:HTTM domain-containing protein [Eudoraea sp.]